MNPAEFALQLQNFDVFSGHLNLAATHITLPLDVYEKDQPVERR